GWDDMGIFNFEGGCYAKIIDLQREKEPAIFDAITHGALVENTLFKAGSNQIDFNNNSITENIRVSYPIHFIPNVLLPSSATHPQNIFFLTCDAYGVLPPVSRLSVDQAMYHFINGYTAKIAGTETGVKEPKATFSACFGAPFLPLPPRDYAMLLKKRLEQFPAQVWLVNTGWTGGAYGTGHRIPLHYTRNILSAVLNGQLDATGFVKEPWFQLSIPVSCPGVPDNLLNPFNTWSNKQAYVTTALQLVEQFRENHAKYQ
ncbi:MAG: phosphoenolpyruvate carboxykinase (ATP), partial [Bacteroidota bacterium]|nr:phosphoenolpyruvate carboxykinase (ATP) [Bacteroidota bacterium]